MAIFPRTGSLRRSLAAWLWLTSAILPSSALAQAAQPSVVIAGRPDAVGQDLTNLLQEAHSRLADGRRAEALRAVDKALSLLASLKNPQAARPQVVFALNDAMALLVALGQIERAHGLLKASSASILASLPPESAGLGIHRLVEAMVLQAAGDLDGAAEAAGTAADILRVAPMDGAARSRFLDQALAVRAAACAARGRAACTGEPAHISADPVAIRALRARAEASGELAGAWYRPDATDQVIARSALADPNRLDAETAFALFQIAARSGPSFDADALTALAKARTEAERRTIHQALRLRARRDRLERAQIQAIGALAAQPAADAAGTLQHDAAIRWVFRDFAVRLTQAEADLARGGVTLSGANIAPLKRFQAALAPNEAALTVAQVDGGLAYLCVRRDRVMRAAASVDLARMKLDGRFLQQALTATHPPSDDADAQFPVEASLRLYDALVRPFEACLRPSDRIVWLPGVATQPVPLAALLRSAPPKAAEGYDLEGAEWLITRHAVSYAGSAAVVLAARGDRRGAGGGFDFLGVGDPLLTGETAEGQSRGAAVLSGVRGAEIAALSPLPETRDELEASAKGFRTARLLLRDEATERRFRGELSGAYRYVSFATHGLIRDDLQGLAEPALVLTPVSAADPTDDGLLTASEIADLQLGARFVALSACNTANFDLDQLSQDLPALASAFAVAGVPATLATLWPVNSDTGKAVVADTFARLRASPGGGAAQALALAQRAFLAAPPSRAYLHPRFWAPFVVLGDGGALSTPAADPEALAIASAEVLSRRGGEVLDVRRAAAGTLARFISDADDAGRRGAGVRLASAGRETWRRDVRDLGASRFTATLGGRLLVSGYQRGPGGRFAPTLEALDPTTGASLARWRDDDPQAGDAFPFGGATLGPNRAVVAVAELRAQGRGPQVQLLQVDANLTPVPLARIEAPMGAALSDATVAPLGEDLIVTFTDRAAAPRDGAPASADDWSTPYCFTERVTWIQRRDGRTGALKAERQVRGLAVATALTRGGTVWLGGAQSAVCGAEPRAVVLAVDADLALRPLYADPALGASEVRSLSPLPNGRILVAASKEAVFDFRTPAMPGPTPDPYRLGALPLTFSGMVFVLDAEGRAGPPRMLDAGNSVFVSGADASRPDDILLGGALGGEAAIFHLSAGKP